MKCSFNDVIHHSKLIEETEHFRWCEEIIFWWRKDDFERSDCDPWILDYLIYIYLCIDKRHILPSFFLFKFCSFFIILFILVWLSMFIFFCNDFYCFIIIEWIFPLFTLVMIERTLLLTTSIQILLFYILWKDASNIL
jgi:hypothetical protein